MFSSLSICALICFILQTKCDDSSDAPINIDPQYANTGACCFFAFDARMDPATLKQAMNVKLQGVASLEKYRFDFASVGSGPLDVYPTVVSDNDEVVWGVAYMAMITEYEAYLSANSIYEGRKIIHNAAVTVNVKTSESTLTVKCNTLQAVNQPKKECPIPENRRPSRSLLDNILNALKGANICPTYIAKIAKIPTK